jgi:hypothetical protein
MYMRSIVSILRLQHRGQQFSIPHFETEGGASEVHAFSLAIRSVKSLIIKEAQINQALGYSEECHFIRVEHYKAESHRFRKGRGHLSSQPG